jgi:large subunit ribosomal protein L17
LKKRVKKIQLSRTSEHTRAILKNLFRSLIENNQVETTTKKAKALKIYADRIISRSKNDPAYMQNKSILKLTTTDMIPKIKALIEKNYSDRTGGYTRIIKLENNRNDCGETSLVKLV